MRSPDTAPEADPGMDRPLRPSPPPRWRRWLPAIGIVSIVAVAALLWLARGSGLGSGNDLAWSEARRGTLEERIAGVGEFVSTHQRQLTVQDAGTVEAVFKRAGEAVEAGEVLVRVVNPQVSLEADSAAIELRRLEMEVADASAKAAKDIESAQLAIANARIALDVAEVERKANAELLGRQIVSRLQYEQAEAKARQARNTLVSAEKMLQLERDQQQQQAEARLENMKLARLQLQRLRERVDALQVIAPDRGVVKRVDVRLGDAIAAGTIIAEVGPIAPDRAVIRFPQREIDRLRPGVPVELSILGRPAVQARIAQVEPDLAGGLIVAHVQADSLPDSARIDMSVRGEAILGELDDVVYAESAFDPPTNGEPLRIFRRRGDEVERLSLAGVRRVGRYLVFANAVAPGDLVAVDSALASQ